MALTDRMLSVARDSKPKVATALGYDAVEFREGFLDPHTTVCLPS